MGRVEGKTAIVTGGGVGIGRATALLLAKEGASVAVTDINAETAKQVADAIASAGGKARAWTLDTSKEQQVEHVFAEVREHFGRIDVLVNNAGIAGASRPTDEITADEWNQVIAVNVNGVFYGTKHVIKYMREAGGGSIINLSSIYGLVGAPDAPPYHASKGAVRLMSKTDALFYASDKIRVNSVHPGFIWTPMVHGFLESLGDIEEGRKQLALLHPLGHVGEPDDIAYGILYLASDESKFVTAASW